MQVSVIKQPTESPERTFDLKLEGLSQNEANFLVTIFGAVAGASDSGRRITDAIYDSLTKQGATNDMDLVRDLSLYIYAESFPKTPKTAPKTQI